MKLYTAIKIVEIDAAHSITGLKSEHKCASVHGHRWKITVTCESYMLYNGMVIDFSEIAGVVNRLDHTYLNDCFDSLNPTAEDLAEYILSNIPHAVKVEVAETPDNIAIVERLGDEREDARDGK